MRTWPSRSLMVGAEPRRFFVPLYVGPGRWVGVWLDGGVDWEELGEFLRDAYLLVALKRLAASLQQA
ncbi:MAG TPA: MmcQ/YjbR family DNA-binding protein [Gemmatimonadales bacterium]|nr:MmcQ/YjbR family DNA-binding protein [Gemmatimonadales bacterium]